MVYINSTNFAPISLIEKDHSMIETRRLKDVLIFSKQLKIMLSREILLSRKIINIYNNIAWKYGNVIVKDFRNMKN